MRIAIMAAGAVGAYCGARLAAAGNDVSFIARGVHFAAIRQHGLKIENVHGDLRLDNPTVTDDPKTIGPVDIVMFAVKLWAPSRRRKQPCRRFALTQGSSPFKTVSTVSSALRLSSG